MSRAPPSSIPGRRSYWVPLLREAGFDEVAAERFPWEVEQTTEDIVALFSTFSNMRAAAGGRADAGARADRRVWPTTSSAGACAGRIRPCSTPGASPAAERQPAWLTLSTALTMPS